MNRLDEAKSFTVRASQMALAGNHLGATATAIAGLYKLIEHIEEARS